MHPAMARALTHVPCNGLNLIMERDPDPNRASPSPEILALPSDVRGGLGVPVSCLKKGFFDVCGGYAGLNGVHVLSGNALATSSAAAMGRSLTRRHEATKDVRMAKGRSGPP
jgi:hypothetical protein